MILFQQKYKKERPMAFAHFTNVKIKGMLTVVPEQEINIYDEA